MEQIEVSPDRRVTGVIVNGRSIGCRAVVSNANLKTTVLKLVGEEHLDSQYAEEALRKYGPVKGSLKAAWRLARCNPWSHGGVDYA